ncbi:MAG: hypothetical protein IJN39_06660 [Clostridia bacterium]|nr:hypothetical protein [Clostridia bacterium]
MKRILCLLYRLLYIIFGVWAFVSCCGYDSAVFSAMLKNTVFWVDFAVLLVILTGFLILVHRNPPNWYYVLKCGATLLSVWLLIMNWDILLSILSQNWFMKILLPFMAVLDWVLFDKKGSLKLSDLLICLLGALLLAGVCKFLFDGLKFDIASVPSWIDLILKLLLPLIVMYLLDKLLSSGLKNSASKICLLFRLFFLIVEAWAFYKLSGGVPLNLFLGLKYFSVIINALGFLCIAVLLIQLMLKKEGKSNPSFLRIKGLIMLCMAVVIIYTLFFVKARPDVQTVQFVHGILGPSLFILDWLLFDKKGAFRGYDPLLWLILPAVYYLITGLILKPFYGINLYPALYGTQPLLLIGGGVVLLLSAGYIYCLLDMILKRK